jgi:hypothetical protein
MNKPSDHAAVLRDLRVGVEMDAPYDPAGQAKLAAIDYALSAMEDARRLDWLEAGVRHYGDGHTEPREASIGWIGWQQSPHEQDFPGLRAAIDASMAQDGGEECR